MNIFVYFLLWSLSDAAPQINLYGTDHADVHDRNGWQHSCLHTVAYTETEKFNRPIISLCLSESPASFPVEAPASFPRFTFAELAMQNVKSDHLYRWSAPIDVIERYQLYLEAAAVEDNPAGSTEIFFNCTMPRFGPRCEYELEVYNDDHTSTREMIVEYYQTYQYAPINLTCYIHLQCNRGPHPACLDWTEICNGKVDCLNGDFDERDCWPLEVNECGADEFRCGNGQCIPRSFYKEKLPLSDCMDMSDEYPIQLVDIQYCDTADLSFQCEDMICGSRTMSSSCYNSRADVLLHAMFSVSNIDVNRDCWSAFLCLLSQLNVFDETYDGYCIGDEPRDVIERSCPTTLLIPIQPIFHGQIYLAYEKGDAESIRQRNPRSPYLCYTDRYYDRYFSSGVKATLKNMTCYRDFSEPNIFNVPFMWDKDAFNKLHRKLRPYILIHNYTTSLCDRLDMYQCKDSSKCISIHRLYDNSKDCPMGDDERGERPESTSIWGQLVDVSGWFEDEERTRQHYINYNVSFPTICDGYNELLPVMLDERNETDETNCQQWQCDNIYTRCDNMWNCPDGADELDCGIVPPIPCGSREHICISPITNDFMCLPLTRGGDGVVDCLGGMDEPLLCRDQTLSESDLKFYCPDENSEPICLRPDHLCNGGNNCYGGEDEQFCVSNKSITQKPYLCASVAFVSASPVEQFLCRSLVSEIKAPIVYFALDASNRPVPTRMQSIAASTPSPQKFYESAPRCHHGLDVRVWLNEEKNSFTQTCLCPPTFHGSICQYQNQRVSLALKFRARSGSWQTPFAIVVSLVDDSDQRTVHSFEWLTYLSMKDCTMKYEMYLSYSSRPKDSSKQYSTQIDIYEKLTLAHRASLLYPIAFPFLPVHRLAYLIDIPPRSDDNVKQCSDHRCDHGDCVLYANQPATDRHFCRCHPGWTGRHCTIPHRCSCSADSLCLGVSASNRSICMCPTHKFGSQCRIHSACHPDEPPVCRNGGQCIPADEHLMPEQQFMCICRTGFSGERCELEDDKLIVSFAEDIPLSQSIFVHFIRVVQDDHPVRTTTFRSLQIRQESLVIKWSQPFHLVFIEPIDKHYYLFLMQTAHTSPATISKTIASSDRCWHIRELFNETFADLHLLQRIKHYHVPCQSQLLNLSCFHDDMHLCTCYNLGHRRLANCLTFDHDMDFDCFGQSECENGGACFQDASHCPQRSMCICPPCFYGGRCQFTTSGFGSSLDAILGYHIKPNVSLLRQPGIVMASMIFTLVFLVAGLANGILAIITFKHKNIREVGCGLYLYGSSIAALCTMIMFGLKFWILLLAQMTRITSRGLLSFQCHSVDFLLRVCLNMDHWLNACVAFERVIITKKGMSFNKKKSQQAARIAITVLLIIIVGTAIHDPLHRRLIVEESDRDEGQRTWCTVSYSHNLQIFNSVVSTFHFFGPFVINLVSAVFLVSNKSRRQVNLNRRQTFQSLLRQQVRLHKHLFTAPVLLVVLALPRLVIGFVSKCMTSANDSWLFLVGYFISFVPPTLTFVIFILPSNFYKRYFHSSVAPHQTG